VGDLEVIQVTPNIFRGPRPKNLRELFRKKVQRIINLESGVVDYFTDDDYEASLPIAVNRGVEYMEVDLSNIFPPSRKKIESILEVLRADPTKRTFIHCMAGKDRTGFVCAVIRMQLCGWGYRRAVNEMIEMGQHWRYRWWIRFLKKYQVKR
jgi:protein tyrosine/serine phosphatase